MFVYYILTASDNCLFRRPVSECDIRIDLIGTVTKINLVKFESVKREKK